MKVIICNNIIKLFDVDATENRPSTVWRTYQYGSSSRFRPGETNDVGGTFSATGCGAGSGAAAGAGAGAAAAGSAAAGASKRICSHDRSGITPADAIVAT